MPNIIMYKGALGFILSLSLFLPCYGREHIQATKDSGRIYSLSFEDGIEDLKCLSRNNEIEDMWIFYDNKWYDIGINGDKNSVHHDKEMIKKLARKGMKVVHTHPLTPDDYRLYPPSSGDIEIFASSLNVEEISNLESESIVADEEGYWTLSLSEEAKKLLLRSKHTGEYNSADKADEIYYNVNSEKLSRKEAIKKIIEECGKIGIGLAYTKL